MRARAESSGRVSVAGTKGLKVGLVGVDVAMVMRLRLARALVSAWMGVYQRGCAVRRSTSWSGRLILKNTVVVEETVARELRVLD
jgi:hypothetical protein